MGIILVALNAAMAASAWTVGEKGALSDAPSLASHLPLRWVPTTCTASVLPYETLRNSEQPIQTLQINSSSGGQLYYFGIEHTTDPSHTQFTKLENEFHRIRPTLIFYEGPARSLANTKERTIQDAGDPGLIRYLARQHDIPTAQLDPPRQAEINILLGQFTPDQLKLFYVLRQIVELRELWHYESEEDLRRAILPILNAISSFDHLDLTITTVDEFEAAYRTHWRSPTDWWETPTQWFNPILTVEETGGVFTNDLHRMASTFRNQYMVEVLSNAVNQGHRVLAVVGKSHVHLQASALYCAIQ